MIRFNRKKGKPAWDAPARDALIREEMQFLLQRDPLRFRRELRGRLLSEGCNLPWVLARPIFYQEMLLRLSSRSDRPEPADGAPSAATWTHRQFHAAMRRCHTALPRPGEAMSRAALDAVAAVIARWQLDSRLLTGRDDRFRIFVARTVSRIISEHPASALDHIPLEQVLRRLRIALTASLFRHLRNPDAFRAAFGTLPEALRTMQEDPEQFSRVMAVCRDQIPPFASLASRIFWRTLHNLDLSPLQSAPA